MIRRLFIKIRQHVLSLENNIYNVLGRRHNPDAFCTLGITDSHTTKETLPTHFLDELLKDSILWAVPKHRRSIEKRLNRKFGWPTQVWKPLIPKKNLLMCNTCGDHHEVGHLCPSCYAKVKKETEEMQKNIEAELGLNPIDKDVVVLYQGEREGVPEEHFKGKRIIEIKRERPAWFSKNLLEQTTKAPASTTSVKPTDLA